MDENSLKNELSMREFLTKKHRTDYVYMFTIFVFIFAIRYFNFIDNGITGTLAGAVIGYFASTIRKIHD